MNSQKTISSHLNIRSSNVNFLKFIAAIMVIFSHSFYVASNVEDPLSVITKGQVNIGGMAVALFFFLSGLYVTKSIYSGDRMLSIYFKKRCIRIFPQLWTVVLVSILILGTILTTKSLISYFTDKTTYMYLLNGVLIPTHDLPGVFENNIYGATVNGPLWTLPIEFFGYVVIGIIFFIDRKLNSRIINFHTMTIAGLALSIAALVYVSYISVDTFLVAVIRAWVFFLIGVEYYNLREKIILNPIVALIASVIIICTFMLPFYNYILLLLLPYVFITISIGIKQLPFSPDILSCSYEMYLIGWPIQQIFTHINGGSMNIYYNFLLTIPFDILIGYIFYIGIKRITTHKSL